MRILARTETATPPDLEEINQIAKSIARIGARIGAGARHANPSLLPKTLIKPYVSSKKAGSAYLTRNSIGGPERGLKRRGAAIQENQSKFKIKWEDRSEDWNRAYDSDPRDAINSGCGINHTAVCIPVCVACAMITCMLPQKGSMQP